METPFSEHAQNWIRKHQAIRLRRLRLGRIKLALGWLVYPVQWVLLVAPLAMLALPIWNLLWRLGHSGIALLQVLHAIPLLLGLLGIVAAFRNAADGWIRALCAAIIIEAALYPFLMNTSLGIWGRLVVLVLCLPSALVWLITVIFIDMFRGEQMARLRDEVNALKNDKAAKTLAGIAAGLKYILLLRHFAIDKDRYNWRPFLTGKFYRHSSDWMFCGVDLPSLNAPILTLADNMNPHTSATVQFLLCSDKDWPEIVSVLIQNANAIVMALPQHMLSSDVKHSRERAYRYLMDDDRAGLVPNRGLMAELRAIIENEQCLARTVFFDGWNHPDLFAPEQKWIRGDTYASMETVDVAHHMRNLVNG